MLQIEFPDENVLDWNDSMKDIKFIEKETVKQEQPLPDKMVNRVTHTSKKLPPLSEPTTKIPERHPVDIKVIEVLSKGNENVQTDQSYQVQRKLERGKQ